MKQLKTNIEHIILYTTGLTIMDQDSQYFYKVVNRIKKIKILYFIKKT